MHLNLQSVVTDRRGSWYSCVKIPPRSPPSPTTKYTPLKFHRNAQKNDGFFCLYLHANIAIWVVPNSGGGDFHHELLGTSSWGRMLAKDDHQSGGSSHDIKIHLFWGNRLPPSTSGEITWIYSLIFRLSSFIHPKRFKSDTLTWRLWKVTPPNKDKFLLWVQYLTSTRNFRGMSIQPTIYPTLSQLQQVSCDFSPLIVDATLIPGGDRSNISNQKGPEFHTVLRRP